MSNSKFFVIISSGVPKNLDPFYEDRNSEFTTIRVDKIFPHKVYEVPSFDDLSSVPFDETTVFVAFKQGDEQGSYDDDGNCGLICNFYLAEQDYLVVLQNGDFIRIPEDKIQYCRRWCETFAPQLFGLKPYPSWEKPLGSDLTDTVCWND